MITNLRMDLRFKLWARRQLWTGQESLEQDDPEMFSLVQQEKRRQVQCRVIVLRVVMYIQGHRIACCYVHKGSLLGVRAGADR